MSKPNLLGFSTSVGYYRNKRVLDTHRILLKQIPRKVPFADLSPTLFQIVMAYAAENQIDGDFSDYTAHDFVGIFATNNVPVSLAEAKTIRDAFDEVGFLEDGKIRSWAKFNRHFAEHEKIVKAKRRAGKMARDKWLRGLKDQNKSASSNGHQETPNPAQNPEKFPSKTVRKTAPKGTEQDAIRKELWTNKELLQSATGKQKKELLAQREKLIAKVTGVESQPAPASPARSASATVPRKRSQAEIEADQLVMAQSTLADSPDLLTDSMVKRLVDAGHKLPAEVLSRVRNPNPVPE